MYVCVVLCSVRSQREDRSSVARQVLPQEVNDPLIHHHGPGSQGMHTQTLAITIHQAYCHTHPGVGRLKHTLKTIQRLFYVMIIANYYLQAAAQLASYYLSLPGPADR